MVTNCWSSNIKVDITKEGLLFFFFLLFKIGIVPFQTWIIDVIRLLLILFTNIYLAT
jgi:hypothetical protein